VACRETDMGRRRFGAGDCLRHEPVEARRVQVVKTHDHRRLTVIAKGRCNSTNRARRRATLPAPYPTIFRVTNYHLSMDTSSQSLVASMIAATKALQPAGSGPGSQILVLVVLALVAAYAWVCVLIARAASRKGRSYRAWFAIAFFVSPILAAVVIAAIASPRPASTGASDLVPCPRCAEPIRSAASVCRFCGMVLDPQSSQ